ncbi:hypothetical protein C7460_105163 [Marinoscillum furvescens DSM 4134]|uniref:Uncharacterized protein n=2 Tax=Marinoscillum furvescens TaxID=1026 RepID=A0A3D9L7S8_MARFU|nr:hypothetical protein C7460_105163 [Marinoscillum furvescens DSM 4134]
MAVKATYRHYFSLLGLLWSLALGAQDLENIQKDNLLSYSGGITVTNTYYHAKGTPMHRDPFFWQVNANLNLSVLDIIQAPFSFTISQQNRSFSQPQPFNRFGISPSYKGVTLHLGHRTLNFSDYTLAGNLFFGVGVEYEPKDNPLRVSAVYGRFAKPVDKFAQDGQIFATPTYRRMGFGAKVGFETSEQRAAVMFFKSLDDVHSITLADSLSEEMVPTPEENLVMGAECGFTIFQRFVVEGEYAYSLFTRDTRIPELFINDYSFINNLAGLYKPNASSTFTNAFKSQLTYQGDQVQINLAYRRVDPGYVTHGSSFLNNDLEDITAGFSLPLFNNKVNLSASTGIQHNNLNDQNVAEVSRVIFSTSSTITASERLNFNLSYSNFSTSTRQLLIRTDILSDTLEFFQVTKSAMFSSNYQVGSGSKKNTLFVSANFQDAHDNQGNASNFKSANAGYSFTLGPSFSANTSLSYNQSESVGTTNTTYGPIFSLSRSFFENKVRNSLSLSVLNSHLGKTLNSNINNIRWSASWSPAKQHNFGLNAFYILKNGRQEQSSQIQELRITFNYSFRI